MTTLGEAARTVLLTPDPHDKRRAARGLARAWRRGQLEHRCDTVMPDRPAWPAEPELLAPNRMPKRGKGGRSEEHTSELQSLMRISYAVFCLTKKKLTSNNLTHQASADLTRPPDTLT